jgi:hypothetical protein
MAFLNQSERDALQKDLKSMKFVQAKRKLRGMDKQGRLVFYRNAQTINHWMTRFELPGMGTQVTLIESHAKTEHVSGKFSSDYALTDVIVEPTAANRT